MRYPPCRCLLSFLVFLALLPLCSCSRTTQAGSVPAPGLASAPPVVAVAKVTFGELSREVVLTAEFRPYQVIDLHAKVAGYVKRINVDVGDSVKTGQLLAVLEVPEMADELSKVAAEKRRSMADLERARGELQRAEANRSLAEVSYNRLFSVTKTDPGLIAQQEIDEASARKRSADAQVAAAKAALGAAEHQVAVSKASEQRAVTMNEYTQITAPFSGMITKRFADTGAMIQAGTASQSQAMPVVRLAEIDHLRLVLPVPESIVPRIRVGAPVKVRVTALNREFAGKVSRYTGDVQMATRTMDAEVDVANPSGVLMPGMYADAVLTLEKNDNALTVPVQALIAREGKRFVMVVKKGVIEERPIQSGIETAASIEVRSGLNAGELVIVGTRTGLKPGQRVEAKIGGVS